MDILSRTEWCMCWRTKWEFEHMADDKGGCKHCGKKIQHFYITTYEAGQ